MASLNLITRNSEQAIFQMPPTIASLGAVVTVKDTSFLTSFSSIMVSTTAPDLFEDMSATKVIDIQKGFASFIAGDDYKWYSIQQTTEPYLKVTSLTVSTIVDATPSYSIFNAV